jgi:ATP-binding cassette, subfamily B, bacterial PglK
MKVLRQTFRLLSREQRRSASMLVVMMIIGMVLETFGIGLIIPVLGLLTADDPASTYPVLAPVLNALGNPGRERIIVVGMLGLMGVYTIKVLFLGWLAWLESRFAFGVQANLSQQLFSGYLRQPWIFHLQRNSAQLIRNAMGEVAQFTSSALLPSMTLLSECLVITGIGILLISVEPMGAIFVVSVLAMAAWIFQHLTRGRILSWGKARQYHEGFRIQHLQQGLGGAKDVKLLGREAEFIEQYVQHNSGSARASQRQYAVKQLPRLWLELLGVGGLTFLVLVMVGQNKPMETLLPTLGLFAAAAFRLMPSTNRVLTSIQSLRYALPIVQNLTKEKDYIDATLGLPQDSSISFDKNIEVEGVVFRYPNAATDALKSVSLTIQKGTSVGIIGSSGSGKSTLVDVILGLLAPQSGCVKIDGKNAQERLRAWQNGIGYVPQTIFLTDDTLRRNVAFGLPAEQIDDKAVAKALRAAQLENFVSELPDGVNTIVGERGVRLSGGQRQRIGIARALYHDPPVLVLDEATSSLDSATEQGLMDAVNSLQGSKTIILVAHRLTTVQRCDCVFVLESGRIACSGTYDQAVTANKGLRQPATEYAKSTAEKGE